MLNASSNVQTYDTCTQASTWINLERKYLKTYVDGNQTHNHHNSSMAGLPVELPEPLGTGWLGVRYLHTSALDAYMFIHQGSPEKSLDLTIFESVPRNSLNVPNPVHVCKSFDELAIEHA